MPKLNLKLQTFISSGLIILLATAIWIYASTFPKLDDGYPGPSLFPRMIALGLGLCGLFLILQTLRNPIPSSDTHSSNNVNLASWGRLLSGLGGMALFPVLYNWIGFIAALSISCLGIALLLKVKLLQALAVAIGASVVIYFLFTEFMSVPL